MTDKYIKKRTKFINFPILLLQEFMKNKTQVLEDIRDYAIYTRSSKYNSPNRLKNGDQAIDYYGLKTDNLEDSLELGEKLYHLYPTGSPMTGISVEVWKSYHENHKSEFENICLLGFLAIKSLLIGKPWYKATNNYWLARMDGKSHNIKDTNELTDVIQKYANEYQLTKIKTELVEKWGLKTYSKHTRGFYVSFKFSLDELALIAEQNKKQNRIKAQQRAVNDAQQKALEAIRGRPP